MLFSLKLVAGEGDYRIEGMFTDLDGEKRLFLASFFLPYNPKILIQSSDSEVLSRCIRAWPEAKSYLKLGSISDPDFIWIDEENYKINPLQDFSELVKQSSVVYTTTNYFDQGIYFQNLKFFLELCNFSLLTHWYWEGRSGNALFVRKDILDATLRTLSYSPSGNRLSIPSTQKSCLESFLKPAENKSPHHFTDQINFIYMINLDERPEKFSLATETLHAFGINPYRFSAVNGWKLPIEVFDELGVKFPSGSLQETLRGSVFKQVDEREYVSHEFLKENGEAFFALGMSRGAVGIVLSHLSVLQDAYKSGYKTIWVMEDDVEVIEDPKIFSRLIQNLDRIAPDWDVLFTDTDTKDTKGNHVPCRAVAARPNYNIEPLSLFLRKFSQVSEEFSRIGMRYGAYSMILRRSGVEKILNYYKTYRIYLPYDLDFWLIPNLQMYAVNKDIISHRVGAPSDNSLPNYLNKDVR